MVRLEAAEVARGAHAMLGPVTLSLGAHGLTALMGPNGAGKTTFMKLLHGLERPRRGRVIWEEGASASQAFVFQKPILLRRSVRANLELPLTLRGETRGEERARLSDRLGLTPLLESHAPRLSGGEAQRLALARALITRPRILFLDEPTANLDAPTAMDMEALLMDEKRAGTRIFLATHGAGQARRLADEVLWVEGGSVSGPFAAYDFFAQPPASARAYLEAHR